MTRAAYICGILLSAGVLLVACSEPTACPWLGPRATLANRLVSGQIVFTLGSNAPETRALSYAEYSARRDGECAAGNLISEVFQNEYVNSAGPSVSCSFERGVRPYVVAQRLRDPRSLTLGSHGLTPAEAGLTVEVSQNAGVAGCRMEAGAATVTVDVQDAVGGAAPYPALVTGDYLRRFSVHVEAVADREVYGSGCVPALLTLDMTLEQTAADAVYDPSSPQPCE